jgi:membrane protein implicated in regulation of membrane protease activity
MVLVESWAWWLLVAVLLCAPVVHTAVIEFVMFGIGAGAASLTAGLGGGIVLQFVVFLATTVGLLVLVRPIAKRQRRSALSVRHGIEALKGAEAVVLERVGSGLRAGGEGQRRGDRRCDRRRALTVRRQCTAVLCAPPSRPRRGPSVWVPSHTTSQPHSVKLFEFELFEGLSRESLWKP